ncbi:hypothetical protein HOY34_11215 [Xinfangfangia sp. D13-10-4-6]|uniref:hypothetical protein n=1 Tax=Pseudogemmobacter hezensis TaxID=2737662 RepID=UPI001551B91C|nr:hypothetical protein [Pseudogemmobacter hezensis]NPD15772.1 hypothetical protein [Pseudogemmobacter hezensis]
MSVYDGLNATDGHLSDIKGLVNALYQISMESACITQTHPDALSINVMIRMIEHCVEVAERQQLTTWAALREAKEEASHAAS